MFRSVPFRHPFLVAVAATRVGFQTGWLLARMTFDSSCPMNVTGMLHTPFRVLVNMFLDAESRYVEE
eukprot:362452-Chlamydomonas_euryale.AAC.9